MNSPSLPYDFAPITFAYINTAKKQGEAIGYNPDLKHLWRILMLAGGWGRATQQPVLAELLYEPVNTTPHPNAVATTSVGYEPNLQRSQKSVIRFENILSGKRPVTRREAEAFHLALGFAFGPKWTNKIEKDALVLMSPNAFFDAISNEELPWPHKLLSAKGISVILEMLPSENLSIRPVFDKENRAGFAPSSPNEDLIGVSRLPVYKTGDRYELQVDGLDAQDKSCIIFELCPDGVRFPERDASSELLPIAVKQTLEPRLILQPSGGFFQIGGATGGFYFVVLTVKEEDSPLLEFFLDGDDTPFDLEKTRRFAEILQREVLAIKGLGRTASHAYQVF